MVFLAGGVTDLYAGDVNAYRTLLKAPRESYLAARTALKADRARYDDLPRVAGTRFLARMGAVTYTWPS